MAKLAYKTRGNSSPQGKERVFFSCHPEDFNIYFESICEEIFQTQNCAIWYDEESETAWDPAEMVTELGRMQLFVIPITSRFLFKENNARTILFRFAMEHHIPVLPLMQESGLEEDFNRICGDLQFLDKNAAISDSTALPYEQKLERFLASVLLGDELAEKVRKAFDAYIFLSYRKKDRKYAQELMRLIHQNDFCRDIAIWYDEFLVPGEDFNHAIQDAMEKSELFTFVVTPNLLEQDNYVMKVEYPVAKETGKPILPAEMVPTDLCALQENYSEIPEPADAHDAPALSDALMQGLRNLAIEENDDDPGHLFFIGLAYLSGIDVEENRERGAQLITTAAKGDVPEAMEKLSQMYNTGEGVERDYEVSARWLEKLADYREKKFEESGDEEDGKSWFSALWTLGDAWYAMRKLDLAKHAFSESVTVSKRMLEQFGGVYWKRSLGVSYIKHGKITQADVGPRAAMIIYGRGRKILEELSRETGTMESIRDLSVTYDNYGSAWQAEGKPGKARAWYEKSLKIKEELSREMGTVESHRSLSFSYNRLGDICKAEGHLGDSRSWYEKGLELAEELNGEIGTAESCRDLSFCFENLGDVSNAEGHPDEAKIWYKKCLEIREGLSRETGTVESCRNLSISFEKFGSICEAEGHLKEARIWYEKSLEIREDLSPKTDTPESHEDLSRSFENLGDVSKAEGHLEEARAWYEKSLKNCVEFMRYSRRNWYNCYNKLGDVSVAEGNLGEARIWYEKALEISEKFRGETVESRRDLSLSYNRMGDICEAEGNLGEARAWYEKGLEISKELGEETGTVESQRNLRISYDNLRRISEAEGDLEKAGNWFEKSLEIDEAPSREAGTVESRRNLSVRFEKMGDVYEEYLESEEAEIWYKESLKIREALSQETGTVESRRDLVNIYNKLAGVCKDDLRPDEAKAWYEKALKITDDV